MKGHITAVEESYPGGVHWEITILPTDVRIKDLTLGWIAVFKLADPLKHIYNCKVQQVHSYEEGLRGHIALVAWWSPECDVDEGPCQENLNVGDDIAFEYDDREKPDDLIHHDCLLDYLEDK